MTKQDLEAIAEALCAAAPDKGMPAQWRAGCDSAREVIARNIADHCARRDPNFKRARFMAACGLPWQA